MGKFRGKWIKTFLLGKKASKSSLSEGREVLQTTNFNWSSAAAKASGVESAVYPPLILHVTPGTALEKGVSSNLLCNDELPRNQDPDAQRTTVPEVANGPEGIRQEQAATKAQSAFRGYLARRAFRALKGIIRLQALFRGHLVRRQAADTLRCMKGIVRFQAVVRGRRVRISDTGLEVHRKCNERRSLEAKYLESIRVNIDRRTEKLLANAFGIKLLASTTTAMPVFLQYWANDPNSAWNWLDRWTSTRFWEPLPPVKKSACAKPQARQRYPKRAEAVPGQSKHNVRKVPAANGSTRSTIESEKPKCRVRKVASHPIESVQKHPQIEHEKVKRTMRKSSSVKASDQVEVEIEKPKRFLQKVASPAAADTSEEGMGNSSEKIRKDTKVEAQKIPDMEAIQIPLTTDEPVENTNVPNHDEEGVQVLERSVLSEAVPAAKGELDSKEDPTDNGNQKGSRKVSFPAKQEYPENGLENTPTLPSYMAATASAKAKLRAQGLPTYSQDVVEKVSLTRRHSLPSFSNGKLDSLSPRAQKLVHGSGKGGVRDRSVLSSGDGKLVQAEWRR